MRTDDRDSEDATPAPAQSEGEAIPQPPHEPRTYTIVVRPVARMGPDGGVGVLAHTEVELLTDVVREDSGFEWSPGAHDRLRLQPLQVKITTDGMTERATARVPTHRTWDRVVARPADTPLPRAPPTTGGPLGTTNDARAVEGQAREW